MKTFIDNRKIVQILVVNRYLYNYQEAIVLLVFPGYPEDESLPFRCS